MSTNTTRGIIEGRIYANDRILQCFNGRINSIRAYIDGGKFRNGRLFRPFELRDLNKLLDGLEKGRERVTKFATKLQKNIKEEINK